MDEYRSTNQQLTILGDINVDKNSTSISPSNQCWVPVIGALCTQISQVWS